AAVRVTISPDGPVRVQSAAHDIGTGAYTAAALTAAEALGVGVEMVEVELGDTSLPPGPIAGGSNTTASLCNAVAKACDEVRQRLAAAAVAEPGAGFANHPERDLGLAGGRLTAPDGHA